MSEYVKIRCCGDCVNYNRRKHKCNIGACDEGKPTDNFFRDCPMGLHIDGDIWQENPIEYTSFVSHCTNHGHELHFQTPVKKYLERVEDVCRDVMEHGKPKWIRVDEALPEVHKEKDWLMSKPVLIVDKDGRMDIASYEVDEDQNGKHTFWLTQGYRYFEPVYWRPLPEPPEEFANG